MCKRKEVEEVETKLKRNVSRYIKAMTLQRAELCGDAATGVEHRPE